jgi:hypothetical protein
LSLAPQSRLFHLQLSLTEISVWLLGGQQEENTIWWWCNSHSCVMSPLYSESYLSCLMFRRCACCFALGSGWGDVTVGKFRETHISYRSTDGVAVCQWWVQPDHCR